MVQLKKPTPGRMQHAAVASPTLWNAPPPEVVLAGCSCGGGRFQWLYCEYVKFLVQIIAFQVYIGVTRPF
jgi:hypothetical protein